MAVAPVGTPAGSLTGGVASHTFSMTIVDVPNRAVAVGIHFGDADANVVSVSVGGVAGTRVVRAAPLSTSHGTEHWVVVNPPAGSQTVQVVLSASAESAVTAQQLQDVDQSSPVRDFLGTQGNSMTPAVVTGSVDSEAGDCVIGFLAMNGTTLPTGDSNQTSFRDTNNSDVACAAHKAGAAGTTSLSWTNNSVALVSWSLAMASYQSPSGGGTPVQSEPVGAVEDEVASITARVLVHIAAAAAQSEVASVVARVIVHAGATAVENELINEPDVTIYVHQGAIAVENEVARYTPSITGTVITPSVLDDDSQIFSPSVGKGVAPQFLGDDSLVYAPLFSSTEANIAPEFVDDSSEVFAPTIQVPAVVTPPRLEDDSAVYAPLFGNMEALDVPFLSDEGTVYAPFFEEKNHLAIDFLEDVGSVYTPAFSSGLAIPFLEDSSEIFEPRFLGRPVESVAGFVYVCYNTLSGAVR